MPIRTRKTSERRYVQRQAGAILMEVILALALLAAGGAVTFGALNASFSAVRNIRMQGQAADLAVTKLSEIQLGVLKGVDDGPNEFKDEDLEGWIWQIVTRPIETDSPIAAQMKQVEIIIAYAPGQTVYRLVQLLANAPDDGSIETGDTLAPEGQL